MGGRRLNAALKIVNIGPQKGPQEAVLSTRADIAIFGGSAGGGKSYALLLEPLRHFNNARFGGVVFRRTSVQIRNEGGLWDESYSLYKQLGAHPREAFLEWTFPAGSRIKFAHLEHEKSIYDWQGSQLAFCVGTGTLIRMADGTLTPVECIRVGDMVETLQGPRRITRTHRRMAKQRYILRCAGMETVIGEDHAVLMNSGAWVSPSGLKPKLWRASGSTDESSMPSFSDETMPRESRPSGREPICARHQQTVRETAQEASDVATANDRSDCAECYDSRPVPPQPEEYFGLVALHGPVAQSVGLGTVYGSPLRVEDRDHVECEPQGSRTDCRAGRGSYGGPLPIDQEAFQERTPLPSDAASHSDHSPTDDRAKIRGHIPTGLYKYRHPYTNTVETSRWAWYPAPSSISPVGAGEVFDLTVAGASHYITSTGLISKNCAFDELTHFTEQMFFYMLSRVRSMSGVPGYVRATTNPDADSWVRTFIDWWIGPDGYPVAERCGKLRWFIRREDLIIWADSREEILAKYGADEIPMSVTFIPSKLDDNPLLLAKDPTYRAKLRALSRVDRLRLEGGNWDVRASAGTLFQREWFPLVDAIPAGCIASVRFWDRAATKPHEGNKNPDWTRGLRLAKYPDGTYVVTDVKSAQDTPGRIETLIKQVAGHDGHYVVIKSQQDPGSAGVSEAEHFTRMLAGYIVKTETMPKDKVTRAKPVSAQAEAGNIRVLRAPWNDAFFQELENFPDGAHDDQVDVLSGAFNELSGASASLLNVL